MLREFPAEVGQVFETYRKGYLGDVQVTFCQQLSWFVQTKKFEIVGDGIIAEWFEFPVQLGMTYGKFPA